ncbi:MAG: hypothetical protein RLY16_2781 [Bacteroidota bacterium]|jgi:hypothetical protein
MKRIFLLFFILSTVLLSCKKDSNSSGITTANVTATVATGSWRVTYYWDTDHEETSNFTNYTFVFSGNGTVTATKDATVVNGTWTTRNDDSTIKLVLAFTTSANFIKISEDWQVVERTDTKIKLQDVSGGNGGTDYLTFEKN